MINIIDLKDIKARKDAGQKKWGKALLYFLQPYFDDGVPGDALVKWLKKEHDIEIELNELHRIKSYYKTKAKSMPVKASNLASEIKTNIESNFIESTENKIEQNEVYIKKERTQFFQSIEDDTELLRKKEQEKQDLFKDSNI